MRIFRDIPLSRFNFTKAAQKNISKLTVEQFKDAERQLLQDYPNGISEGILNEIFTGDFWYLCDLIDLDYDEETGKVTQQRK